MNPLSSPGMKVESLVLVERIERTILLIRNQKVMLDADLAKLYGVTTKALNQAVKRNRNRFPEDFAFQLTWQEGEQLSRSQSVTLSRGKNIKYRPYAFTEQGVAMLSSVLRSERAAEVNVAIMRVFVRLRELVAGNRDLARRLDELERKSDVRFRAVFVAIRKLMGSAPVPPKQRIGFRPDTK